jgi:hypothetical protein
MRVLCLRLVVVVGEVPRERPRVASPPGSGRHPARRLPWLLPPRLATFVHYLARSMPNQLFVPFKKTGEISIRQHTRDYINEHRIDTNANAFKWDIDRWEKLRADATDTSTVHVNRIDVMIKCA